jgi:hypothetical protein
MAELPTEISALEHRFQARLDDLHDDFVYTRMLWQTQLVSAASGAVPIRVHNPLTGNVASTGADLAARARSSQARLRVRCFKDLTAQFELFVDELLRLWLTDKPALLSARGSTVGAVLSGTDLAKVQAAVIAEAVESTILDKLKGKPDGWIRYLSTNLSVKLKVGDTALFIEMKARRDASEYHNGNVDYTYLKNSGSSARYNLADVIDVIDVSNDDVDEAYTLIHRMIASSATDATAKAGVPVKDQ